MRLPLDLSARDKRVFINQLQIKVIRREANTDLFIYSRSAAEIDELYERRIPAWRWATTTTAAEEQMREVLEAKKEIGLKSFHEEK